MRPFRLGRPRRLTKQKALAYALSAAIFGAAMWMALRLSFPPDPYARRGHVSVEQTSSVGVDADSNQLIINRGNESRSFRFRQTEDGVVAEEVSE